jgi:hypothetical protein
MSVNVTDLDRLSDEEIKTLYHGILALRRTRAGHALIDQSIAKIREGHGLKPQRFEVPVNFGNGGEDFEQ